LRRSLLIAALVAAVWITAAPAGAATLRGRILGHPQVSGTHARVPLLLADGTEAVLTVPARSGFRTTSTGRTSAPRTRLGDAVKAQVRSLRGGRAEARYLVIVVRSAAPAFGDLQERLGASSAGVRRAAAEVARLGATDVGRSTDPGPLRLFLLQVRYSLNLLISDLRDQAGGMERVAGDVRALPKGDALAGQLEDAAGGARGAATKLEDGVTGLDIVINAIGGASGEPLPVGTVSEAGQVLNAALQVLDGLDPQDDVPGAPTLPDPLGGVPVPPLPPVLP
jgi:hypothetical protein